MRQSTGKRSSTQSKRNKAVIANLAEIWTDEVINKLDDEDVDTNINKEENMDTKIERVQRKKREAKERAMRIANKPPAPPQETIEQYINIQDYPSSISSIQRLQYALNNFHQKLINSRPSLSKENRFPLYLYDSSLFNEMMPLSILSSTNIENESLLEGIYLTSSNTWAPCIIKSQITTDQFNIIPTTAAPILIKCHRIHLYTLNDSFHNITQRLSAAYQHRYNCLLLLQYTHQLSCIPFDLNISYSMSNQLIDKIKSKAMSISLDKCSPIVFSELINEAKLCYETVMNNIIFRKTLSISPSSLSIYSTSIDVFKQIFITNNKLIPLTGTISMPNHEAKLIQNQFEKFSFLCSSSALQAIRATVVENINISSMKILPTSYTSTYSLTAFERYLNDNLSLSIRCIKQEWPQKIATAIRKPLLEDGNKKYNLSIRTAHEYESSANAITLLLNQINFMMTDTLTNIVTKAYIDFANFIQSLCHINIDIIDISTVNVSPSNPLTEIKSEDGSQHNNTYIHNLTIYKQLGLPPLFSLTIKISTELKVRNQNEIQNRIQEIQNWNVNNTTDCHLTEIEPISGHVFEYDSNLDDFKQIILNVFDTLIVEFSDVSHVRKYVMDRVYFPTSKSIGSIDTNAPWLKNTIDSLSLALHHAISPVANYLLLFKQYEDFINIDNNEYIKNSIRVNRKDLDSTEIELPVTVNLNEVTKFINYHLSQYESIQSHVPRLPIDCGLFSIHVDNIKSYLLDKHKQIVQATLIAHAAYSKEICKYLDAEFRKILHMIATRPLNIEELVEMEEYIAGVALILAPLQTGISDMLSYHELLDEFHYKIDAEHFSLLWAIVGYPSKVLHRCEETVEQNLSIKRRFKEDMQAEQSQFSKDLEILEHSIRELDSYHDLDDVKNIASAVRQVGSRMQLAQEKVKLYNTREGLFDIDCTDYDDLIRLQRMFDPFSNLWCTAEEWLEDKVSWTNTLFMETDAELIESKMEHFQSAIVKAFKYFTKAEMMEQTTIANLIKTEIHDFMPDVPLIVTLRNPGMRDRHWNEIVETMRVTLPPLDEMTTQYILSLGLKDHIETVQKIGESAAKEYQIEHALDKMEGEWEAIHLDIHAYRETGTSVLKGVDEINTVLDEQITMTQAIMFSAFKGPFESRIEEWNRKLNCISDLLEVWIAVQRNWLYLQPIFESADINRQLPTEGKKFESVDKVWRTTLANAKSNTKVIEFCDNEKLLEKFKESERLLDEVQKGLSDYLETKRSVFARFYFLSNDELLSILSESKDVKLVQPHLKKCFEGIDKVHFLDDLKIDKFISPEGEEIVCSRIIDPVGASVERWMLELESVMRSSIRQVMRAAIQDYITISRSQWMQKWPGMVVLNGSQTHWTREMEELFTTHGELGPHEMYERQVAQLAEMTVLVRGKLNSAARVTIGALTVIDVHARDVIKKLVVEEVSTADHFSWMSQLRYYWIDDNLNAQMVAASRLYGYEYLGNTFRLVITPLTDKCYLTLMGALQMIFGGAPAGPAGTGKTETTKDLAKALAMQCVVFNCSDGLDYIAMGKFFKGLAACGAWACFDEFNRINIEVLSVIGQQIMSIQSVIRAGETRMYFENSEIAVSANFSVFITMNPGYAGRSALPDSLQALFRPVAMMVPDYALIGEIMFFAYGFELAKECGAKMVTTFKLCSEQLSAQAHYDYGMRAVKTVITAAGNLKRAEPDADEMVLLLRALQDVNIPKFLEMDLPLYAGIISDLFPGKVRPQLDYGALMRSMKHEIHKAGLQPVQFFTYKVIQLYEMIIVRHGLMLVGPTGGGKSSNLHVLRDALTSLKKEGVQGFAYEKVIIYQLNPKSITMGQMYGEADPNTMEWKDGIMSTMYRNAGVDTPDRKWIMFDGPVDAIWIENMNTVLDDNKKLCLNSGEIIKMSSQMTMMFEVEDLLVASPATVSRVGIIYMEPKGLGLDVLLVSWLEKLPECVPTIVKSKLTYLFDLYMQPCVSYMRTFLKEVVPTVDNNLCESLMRILDCYIYPYIPEEGKAHPTDVMIADLVTCIDALFVFALIWSVGATVNEESRKLFDAFIRAELMANKYPWPFPKVGTVYDYLFTMEHKQWTKWMDITEPYQIDSRQGFSEIVVPTTDSVRNTYLLDILLTRDKHVLMVGNTGTGKTINISQYLSGTAKVQGRVLPSNVIPLTLMFSANTSANMTQDLLDSKMDKRKKGVFGPAAGKRFYIYVDDMNMPKREEYGAQPPIELLRQWFDQGGWYDRKDLSFRKLIDLTFVASMGPPGGGRQTITPRFLRHFNIIGYVEMSDASKALIFGSILRSFLSTFDHDIVSLTDSIVQSSVNVFATIMKELLPTPSKTHYTFNLRDLAKIFQGMLMTEPKRISSKEEIARLWVHESLRVFGDRLTCPEDHQWLGALLKENILTNFSMSWSSVVPRERLIYCDFIDGAESKIYQEVESMDVLKRIVEDCLVEHNNDSKSPMPLVIFTDALEHVARIARVLRQPQGNALLLGVGGSGRQSMTKLANYIVGYDLKTVEIVKGYSMTDWREDVKKILMVAGVKDRPTTFLFSDVQIINERMVEDINNILNAGDVPNLYAPEDMEAISNACRVECQKRKIPPTKINIFSQYIIRVRKNIHLCIAMSPLGEAFRNRLRNYPSLVNCCTIDWFTNWPAEALQSVGTSILLKNDLDLEEHEDGTVQMFKEVHLSVENTSIEFYDMLRRRNYVTPTSYLELLSSFAKLFVTKRAEILTKINRLQSGLDKLSETKSVVGTMQEELVVLQPQLVTTQAEVASMMTVITKDKASAAETKALVQVEETNANEKAAAAKAIADDAQRDLAEAIPALNEAVKCLDELKKSDIDELKGMMKPPAGVVLTMKVCCFMFPETKIIKKNDPNTPGKKFDDYWESGQKGLLADPKVFIEALKNYDKDNIPDKIIKNIAQFMTMEEFSPAAIERSSKACTAICMWARAMYKYHFVALGVAPKRARLKEAEDELAIVMEQLAKAKATLKDVNDRLAELETSYNEAVEKKEMLEKKEQSCKIQLKNADKLIGGLGGEETRWKETVTLLEKAYKNVLGDVIVSAGTISYLGPFTSDFRQRLVGSWQNTLLTLRIPHTWGCNLEVTLADPVKVRSWQLCSLPSDSLSTQNAIIIDNGRRWPLLIDPQGQGNRYIKAMAKDPLFAENGIDVIKLSDKNFLRRLENGIQLGSWVLLENIAESLDAALEPILLQQKFKQGGQEVMKLGDNIIPYNNSFRFFLTTKLANPHYPPEVQVKVSLLNFTITVSGLEEQLLNVVVSEELPDLSQQKANLVIQNASMNKQLYDIESEILLLLSKSEGNILDDTVLIETLAQSKKTSEEIKEKMKEATVIQEEIVVQSELYRPVAKRASLLYFVIADLGQVDPMYQYSLPWFTQLFIRGIGASTKSNELTERIEYLNDYFSYSVYINICRSLFEKHKLLFSFIMCVSILQGDGQINSTEYRFLLSGISPSKVEYPLPKSTWLEGNVWSDLCDMSGLEAFKLLPSLFETHIHEWKKVFDSNEPHRANLPPPCTDLTPLQRLCVLRCLRRDKIDPAMQDFIVKYLDDRFIQPPPFDLRGCYNDSTVFTPLIFILSSGSDPNKELDLLADEMNMKERLKRIALGQGQGTKAFNLVSRGMEVGEWIMLQNCHLSISWMPTLEQICEGMDDRIHPDFRLWLTSMPSESFPTSCLQNGVKITKEPPKGLRANLKNTYMKLDNDKLKKTNKPEAFQKLLFGLSFYHALVIERKKFGPLGWNIPYEFNDTDMDITAAQLELYVSLYTDIPYKVLQQLTSVVNYGGRITDDKDMRTSDIIIADFFNERILESGYSFSKSGIYNSVDPDCDAPHSSYIEYIDSLPLNAEPEVFGMHENANITCAITEADTVFDIILTLQPRVAAGAGISREDFIVDMAKQMELQLPAVYDIEALMLLYPTDYHESMNTVLVQEAERYNKLLRVMHTSLRELQRALKGLVILSAELEAMGDAIFDQRVPAAWTSSAYPSLKPLGSWFRDLIQRLDFITNWIEKGAPIAFWISGFFFPQGFLTAIIQNYARKYHYPIDTVTFAFIMKPEALLDVKVGPPDGSYVYGMYLEGARWDKEAGSLVDPKQKELFSPMPVIHMQPEKNRVPPAVGIYRAPVYKILTRTGTLSTTGHSTNFVTWIEVPSNKSTVMRSSLVSETNAQIQLCDQDYWIKAGVACFCALRY